MFLTQKDEGFAILRDVMDTLAEPFLVFDGSGAVVHRNTAFRREITSRNDRAIIQRAALELVHMGARQQRVAPRRLITDGGSYEIRVLSRDVASPTDFAFVSLDTLAVSHSRESLELRYQLTPREARVANLVANGKSNGELARVLGISYHTARHHVSQVLRKLGFSRRSQVASLLRDSSD